MVAILLKLFGFTISACWLIFLIKAAGGGATRYSGDDRQGAGSDY
jgi:hypothetical protein